MKKWMILCSCFLLWVAVPMSVEAETLVNEYFDFNEVDKILDEIFPKAKLKFSDLLTEITEGEQVWNTLWNYFLEQISYELHNAKGSIIQLILIVLVAAVFHNFSEIFQNKQVSELGFYVLYMLFISICLGAFRGLMDSVQAGITNLLLFFKALGPIYFMGIAITTGSATSIAFYNIMLFIIYLLEVLVTNVLLPLVQTFFILRVLNEMSKEEYLSKFGDFIQMLIKWILRGVLAVVLGLNIIQRMLSPAIDTVKRSAIIRGGETIPFIGDVIGGTAEVMLGTLVLIRNGIGVAGVLVCTAICLVPVAQMTAVVILYKLAAAVIQPISEKRMVNCIGNIADGASLLLQIILTSCVLFLIVIAIVANST